MKYSPGNAPDGHRPGLISFIFKLLSFIFNPPECMG